MWCGRKARHIFIERLESAPGQALTNWSTERLHPIEISWVAGNGKCKYGEHGKKYFTHSAARKALISKSKTVKHWHCLLNWIYPPDLMLAWSVPTGRASRAAGVFWACPGLIWLGFFVGPGWPGPPLFKSPKCCFWSIFISFKPRFLHY